MHKPPKHDTVVVIVLMQSFHPMALCMCCCRYFAALTIDNVWCVYPWDAEDIYAHTITAEATAKQPEHAAAPAAQMCQSSAGASPAAVNVGGIVGTGAPHMGGLLNGAGGFRKSDPQNLQAVQRCKAAAAAAACVNGALR